MNTRALAALNALSDPKMPRKSYAKASTEFLEGRGQGISTIPRWAMVERRLDPDLWIAAAYEAERRLLPLARAGYHIDRIESAFERAICRVYNRLRIVAARA